jgi:hypothetical protein
VRVVDPDFGIDDSVIDFDSFQVPLYRTPERGEISTEDVGLDALRRNELLRSLDQGRGEDESENP